MNQDMNQANGNPVSQPAPKKNYTTLLLVLLLVSVIANIWLLYSKNQVSEQNTFLITENTDLNAAKDTLQGQYDAALARLDELTGKNAELDQMMKDRDGEISKLKSEIKSLLNKRNASLSDLKKAQSLIASLNTKAKTYEERIAELEKENTTLTQGNARLTEQNDSLSGEAENLRKLGSVLHISNIRMEPINLKKNGEKEVSTTKARKTDLLRVVFDIDENRVMNSGTVEIYVVIEGTDGKLLSNAAYGSGVTTDADGNPLNYTVVKRVNLEKGQKLTNVSVDWKQESNYQKGDYTISFYNNGYKIGSGSIHLK
jgi:predicted nuclease with TOPRIM domain